MKKNIFIAALIFFAQSAQATILTVDNNLNAPSGVYTTFSAAHDDAVANDTIYMKASGTNYGTISITKSGLTIIGDGFSPEHLNGAGTNVGSILIYSINGLTLTGLSASGLTFNNAASNVILERNMFSQISIINDLSNVIIKNNYIPQNAYGIFTNPAGNRTGIIISNNIFSGNGGAFRITLKSTSPNAFVFENNIVLNGANAGSPTQSPIDANNTTIRNNIFYSSEGVATWSIDNCSFQNNLVYTKNGNGVVPVNGNAIISGTIINTPTYLSGVLDASNAFNWNGFTVADYELASGSAGENAGTDGTDVGIFGGTNPWPVGSTFESGYKYRPVPFLPHITEIYILNTTAPTNGTLNVRVKAKKQY